MPMNSKHVRSRSAAKKGTETRSTGPRRHADIPRGMAAPPPSATPPGRFGRLFPAQNRPDNAEPHLRLLAETMIARAKPDQDLDGNDTEENGAIAAGYTYLGQFIDHDLTFDPVSSLQRRTDPTALIDYRTPKFDLDSVYGRGPADEPYLYAPDEDVEIAGKQIRLPSGVRFLLGAEVGAVADLPRNMVADPESGNLMPLRALIGDPRNDENLIVSQLHRTFLQFHNAVFDHTLQKEVEAKSLRAVHARLESGELFETVQQLVRWHYQWIVVHDFLPTVCGEQVVKDILGGGPGETFGNPRLQFYPTDFAEHGDGPFIPVEFSAAAYRFGHSMVRPSYFINDETRAQSLRRGGESLRIPIVGRAVGDGLSNLDGFRPLPSEAGIEWRYFFKGLGDSMPDSKLLPQPSYKIDTSLAHPLGSLPNEITRSPPNSLALRNLMRGQALGLPSGQYVAGQMRLNCLSDEELGLDEAGLRARLQRVRDDIQPGEAATSDEDNLIRAAASDFKGNAPLWYYILKEAELGGGHQLGETGARIVAEVIIGLLAADKTSYLRMQSDWKPTLPHTGESFDIAALIGFAMRGPDGHASAGIKRGKQMAQTPGYTGTNAQAAQADTVQYVNFGQLVWGEVPYDYKKAGATFMLQSRQAVSPTTHLDRQSQDDNQKVWVDGPAKDFGNNAGRVLPIDNKTATRRSVVDSQGSPISEESIRNFPQGSIWWYFDGQAHRVTKALRIPYTVPDPAHPGGPPIVKHILVGYEGVDGGGG